MANSTTDRQTMALIKDVARRKREIAQAERPVWLTNCSFCYSEHVLQNPTNLHVESNVQTLIKIAAFIDGRAREYEHMANRFAERSYDDDTARLTISNSVPPFTWQTFSAADWLTDIRSRLNKIQIEAKRKKLEAVEARLNAIVSPELRAKMELEAIAEELA